MIPEFPFYRDYEGQGEFGPDRGVAIELLSRVNLDGLSC